MSRLARAVAVAVLAVACNGSFAFDVANDAGVTGGSGGGGGSGAGLGGSAGSGASGAVNAECALDLDCPEPGRGRCDPSQGRCVGCLGDGDCGDGLGCERLSHECIATCGDDDDCPWSEQWCYRGACIRCDGDEECRQMPETPHCMPGGARCVACVADVACPAASPHCDPVLFECVACRDSRDCPSEMRCDISAHVCG